MYIICNSKIIFGHGSVPCEGSDWEQAHRQKSRESH